MALRWNTTFRGIAFDAYLRVTPHVKKTRTSGLPTDDAGQLAYVAQCEAEAIAAAAAEKKSVEDQVRAGQQAAAAARNRLMDATIYDQRSIAVIDIFAEDPGDKLDAKPVDRTFVAYDHDFSDGAASPLAQAYAAVKADPRFAGASDA